MKLYNLTTEKIVCSKVEIALSFFARLVGLIPKRDIPLDYCLMIPGCISVHTFFMSFDIDVVFVDSKFNVIDIVRLKPWRISKFYFSSENVFEFKADFVYDKISIGDKLALVD